MIERAKRFLNLYKIYRDGIARFDLKNASKDRRFLDNLKALSKLDIQG